MGNEEGMQTAYVARTPMEEAFGQALDALEVALLRWRQEPDHIANKEALASAADDVALARAAAISGFRAALRCLGKALEAGCSKEDVLSLLGVLGPVWEARELLRLADPGGYLGGSSRRD